MSDEIAAELNDWGKVLVLTTRGRHTGDPARAAVGFLEAPDGTLLVAAGAPDNDWARNLAREPRVMVTLGGATREYRASELEGDARNGAIAALILKYGTPAERLGRGPAFRLAPVAEWSPL